MDGNNPNILSELSWEKLKGIQLGAELEMKYYKRYLFNMAYNNSFIYNGIVYDTDYKYDNKQGMYSNLLLSSHKGYMRKFDLSSGYLVINKTRFTTGIGLVYSRSLQRFYLLNFKKSIDNVVDDLYSYYQNNWNSYGVYLVGGYYLSKKINFSFRTVLQFSDYKASANWNLIKDFEKPISFIHTAKGHSSDLNFKIKYDISDILSLNLSNTLLTNKANNGVDELFLKNNPSVKTKLNGVRSLMFFSAIGISLKLDDY